LTDDAKRCRERCRFVSYDTTGAADAVPRGNRRLFLDV
jgi:hypothetical protein